MDISSVRIPAFITITGYFGIFCGATMIFSIISDLISFSTLHISLLYSVSTRIYYWHFNILSSTFNIFRGKKHNPLRKRIDNAEYDLDQTLIGTIIFTLFLFLAPTIAAYYLLFSIVRYITD